MSLVPRLLLLMLAAAALLLGIQIPSFVDQYEKRLDAHLIEVQNNLKPFQDIANQFHGGSLEALIQKHEQSDDPTFKAEGGAIRNMLDRFHRFQREQQMLRGALPKKVQFLVTGADRELLRETRASYSFAILLDQNAVVAGLAFMFLAVVLFEWLAVLIGWMLPGEKRPRRT